MSFEQFHTNESSSYYKSGQEPEPADQWSIREQENDGSAVPPALWEIKRIGGLNEIDRQRLISSHVVAALIDAQTYPVVTKSDAAPLRLGEFRGPSKNGARLSDELCSERDLWLAIVTGAFLVALGLGWFGGANYFDRRDALTGRAAVNAVVERIIGVESNGNPNAKNSRSSATGLGQFLNETWLDLVRTYRPDLIRGHSESETLELRREAKLAREITTRFVERNAAMLRRRGLPVTAGTIYLAHFAGGAGAVAILSAPENADAAFVMATADATGRTKRERILKANPFLEHFTVADLKIWADRKMRAPGLDLTEVFAADGKR
jgi:hypothetical protein